VATIQQIETEPRTGQVRFDGFISYSHTADELLAPRLQTALQTFAKPWWKRRALRIFRDQSSLSANPHLWSSITAALDASDWFILLTSPEAARSSWVDREVAYWREHKDPEKILPVLTDGTLAWDEASGRLNSSSSVPPALLDAFKGEPRWVDLRWAEEETQLDLRNGRFRDAIADIAASLRGIPKDDLESEEVRQHRRTRRTAWAAGLILAILAIAAVTGAVIAVDQREQAESQRVLAEAETVRAESAESLARSRELAASAINVLDDNPELSVLLGLEAIESTPTGAQQPVEAINALREATHASRLRSRTVVAPGGGFVALDLSPDGSRLATLSQIDARVVVTDAVTGREISMYAEPTTVDSMFSLSFSADGSVLAVGVTDSARQAFTVFASAPTRPRPGSETPDDLPPRVILLRADTGEVLRTIDYPSCLNATPFPRFSPDGAWLAVAGLSGDECQADSWSVELFDAESFQFVDRWETTADMALTWTADGSRLSVSSVNSSVSGTTVFDVATRQAVVDYPSSTGVISPDGRILVVDQLASMDVIDLASGVRTDVLTGFDHLALSKAFTPDGSKLLVATIGQELFVFDLSSGKLLQRLGPTGVAVSFDCIDSCETLLQTNLEGEILVWDLSTTAGGEFNSVNTGYFVNSESLTAGGALGLFLGFSDLPHPHVVPFDRATGQISDARRFTETNSPIPLPDGRILLLEVSDTAPEWGPVVAWDPESGTVEEVVGCWTTAEQFDRSGLQGVASVPCDDRAGNYFILDKAFLSPDESSLLISDPGGEVKILDARTLAEESVPRMPAGHRTVLVYGGSWLLSSNGEVAKVVDLSDGRVLATLPTGNSDSWSGVSTAGDLAAIYEWDNELTIYDTASWEAITSFVPGPSRGIAFSPDGSKILTAQSDGYVRIWDTRAGSELFRIPLPGASDGHWLDETHIAIGASTGLWTTVTLDLEELKGLAISRLTRGLTAEECDTYSIDPCPDLETIKSR
jgi:WD40 repeat protein